jgi:alpha-mannosidase
MPSVLEPGGLYPFIDQGLQRFTYSLLPHAGSWEQAGTVQRAAELNQRPIALQAAAHPQGDLPLTQGFIDAAPANVLVTVLKQAEEGGDLILRAYETSGEATQAQIALPQWGRTLVSDFGANEIKTFRIPRDLNQPAAETNLLEWPEPG